MSHGDDDDLGCPGPFRAADSDERWWRERYESAVREVQDAQFACQRMMTGQDQIDVNAYFRRIKEILYKYAHE